MGGRGTRLAPLTDSRPKPLLPIVDRCFLEHQLSYLARHGVTDVTFACGFLPQQIVGHFGDRFGDVGLRYAIEPMPLGTGGAIGFAARTLAPQRLIVCNGDVLTDLDLSELVDTHERSGARATIALTPVEDPSRYGLVRCGEDGAVLAFLEKPSADEIDTNLINAGTYVLEPDILQLIPEDGPCSVERDVFPALVGNGLFARADDAYWNDIGTVPSYLQANADLLAGRVGTPARDRSLVEVAESATVSPDARLHAPCFIGDGVVVGAGADIGPNSVVSEGVKISTGARVVRSVVLEQAQIAAEVHIVDSIVGEGASILARTTLSDYAVAAPGATVDGGIVRGEAALRE